MPRWYEAVERISKLTPAAPSYRITRSLPGGRVDNVVEVEPTENLAVIDEIREGPTPFRYRYTINADGTGTVLTLNAERSNGACDATSSDSAVIRPEGCAGVPLAPGGGQEFGRTSL
jgi:hypothetical protein